MSLFFSHELWKLILRISCFKSQKQSDPFRVRTAMIILLFQFLIFRCVVAINDENPFSQTARYPSHMRRTIWKFISGLKTARLGSAFMLDDEKTQQYHCCEEFSPGSLWFQNACDHTSDWTRWIQIRFSLFCWDNGRARDDKLRTRSFLLIWRNCHLSFLGSNNCRSRIQD